MIGALHCKLEDVNCKVHSLSPGLRQRPCIETSTRGSFTRKEEMPHGKTKKENAVDCTSRAHRCFLGTVSG